MNERFVPTGELSCADLGDQEAAYVWGALDADERALVEQHRRQCAACDRRLSAAERTVGQLDAAQPRLAPPPELRARVLAAIDATRPSRPNPPQPVAPVAVPLSTPGHGRGAGRGRRRRLSSFGSGVATGFVAALAVVAVAWLIVLRPEVLGLAGPQQSGYAEGSGAGAPLPPLPIPGLGASAPVALTELKADDSQGFGWLAYDATTGRGVLMLERPTAAGTTYQVWLSGDGQRVDVGSFDVDGQGFASFALPDPPALAHLSRIELVPVGGGASLAADL